MTVMPFRVRDTETGHEFTVRMSREDLDATEHLELLEDKPAVDGSGYSLPAEPVKAPSPEDLKGAALDDALKNAGLPTSGSADEKRARLAEHNAEVAQ